MTPPAVDSGDVAIEHARREDGGVAARIRNPRLRRPADLVVLTDLGGRMLDAAFPGRRSALSRRFSRSAAPEAGDVLFGEAPDGPLLLYAVFAGAWAVVGAPPPVRGAADYVERVNAPFLAPSAHGACTAAEAIALGASVEDVLRGAAVDLTGRVDDVDALETAAAEVRSGKRDVEDAILAFAAGGAVAGAHFGARRAPAASRMRARATFVARLAADFDGRPLRRRRPEGGAEATVEDAFGAFGVAFDAALWRSEHFEPLLASVDGDPAAFARRANPLRLIAS